MSREHFAVNTEAPIGFFISPGPANESDLSFSVVGDEVADDALETGLVVDDDVGQAGDGDADGDQGQPVVAIQQLTKMFGSLAGEQGPRHGDHAVEMMLLGEVVEYLMA